MLKTLLLLPASLSPVLTVVWIALLDLSSSPLPFLISLVTHFPKFTLLQPLKASYCPSNWPTPFPSRVFVLYSWNILYISTSPSLFLSHLLKSHLFNEICSNLTFSVSPTLAHWSANLIFYSKTPRTCQFHIPQMTLPSLLSLLSSNTLHSCFIYSLMVFPLAEAT